MIDQGILRLVQKRFPSITEKALQEEIVQAGKLMTFEAGETIMDYGAYIKFVPLVLDGCIKVIREDDDKGDELFLYFLQGGDTCSMSFSCCMMNKQSAIRTVTEEQTTLIGIPVKYVDEWMMKYPSWKNFVMRSYDFRMQELVRTIDAITFSSMDQRLEQYLLQKTKALNTDTITTTHQSIALDLNASREAVSRLLKKMEKLGKIRLGRNKIEILDRS